MIANIAKVLKIPAADINIKAKTNEGMGFVGRGEGMAVSAVVTLNKE
jgi:2-C-methyl-D-erythritol 2,4-cyclodiphosphate synthase